MISLDEEVRLYTTNAEREKYNLLATLFGIIVSLDFLERAYVRDSITAAEYDFAFCCYLVQPTKKKGTLQHAHDCYHSTRQC